MTSTVPPSIDALGGATANPILTPDHVARLCARGRREVRAPGDDLYDARGGGYELVHLIDGVVDVVRPAPPGGEGDTPLARFAAGMFLGELGLLTGQSSLLSARVVETATVCRVGAAELRRLMAEDDALSEVLLGAFEARRVLLQDGDGSSALALVGSRLDAQAQALRNFAVRRRLPHVWLDAETAQGAALMRAAGVADDELPAAVFGARVLRRAGAGDLADALGLTYRPTSGPPADVAIVGAGPAGLAAAIYAASEGLSTVLLDAVAAGGQAGASARIENYLGFPGGVSGAELAQRAETQALKFGARLAAPCRVEALELGGEHLTLRLTSGDAVHARTVVVATGAWYRSLPLARWPELTGTSIHHAATEMEVAPMAGRPVAVLGGANSAGQAALYLARAGCDVTVVLRGPDIGARMSAYLVDRIAADPAIAVTTGTNVVGLHGERALAAIDLAGPDGTRRVDCHGLFSFIGAEPAAAWLPAEVARDASGFVLTDVALGDVAGAARAPLPFETSVPGVFAVGDVRSGSMKRVAAATGEGASAIRSIHQAIGVAV
jgi:thioredoxin reductase (NADPH)